MGIALKNIIIQWIKNKPRLLKKYNLQWGVYYGQIKIWPRPRERHMLNKRDSAFFAKSFCLIEMHQKSIIFKSSFIRAREGIELDICDPDFSYQLRNLIMGFGYHIKDRLRYVHSAG